MRKEDEGTDNTRKPDSPNGETENVRCIASKSTLGCPDLRKAQLKDDTLIRKAQLDDDTI